MVATGETIHVRRGRRSDFPRVRALLPVAADARQERFDRRTFASLTGDVYVAEDAAGAILGLVAVGYLRSVTAGRTIAVLDAVRAIADAAPVLDRLIAFAEARARRRGCTRLTAWGDPGNAALQAALASRGYRSHAVLVTDLGGAD